MLKMKNLLIFDRIVTVAMGISVGIWIGMDIALYAEDVSSIIYFIAIFLTLAGACVKMWLHHQGQKQYGSEQQENSDTK